MRIIAYDRFRPGVTMERIIPYLPEEVSNVWRLWKAGIVRENYARADEPAVRSSATASSSVNSAWKAWPVMEMNWNRSASCRLCPSD
jgi:hypothetical protein